MHCVRPYKYRGISILHSMALKPSITTELQFSSPVDCNFLLVLCYILPGGAFSKIILASFDWGHCLTLLNFRLL